MKLNRQSLLIIFISSIFGGIATRLTLITPACGQILDCYSLPLGGWPLAFRTMSGGGFAIPIVNWSSFALDWLFFSILIYIFLSIIAFVVRKFTS